MDDTLDYIATQEELGKDIGKDLQEGKITLPLIHALECASPEEKKEVIAAVEQEQLEEQALENVLDLINKYEGIEYSIQKAKDHAQQGKHILNGLFSPSPEKEALLAVADYVIERRS
jgi:octaprenyl-diphosphate synthase